MHLRGIESLQPSRPVLTVKIDRVTPPIPAAHGVGGRGYGLRVKNDDVVQLSDLVVSGVSRIFIPDQITVANQEDVQ